MSENEIIRLKKDIHHLREKNADLEAEMDEKNNRLGELEEKYKKMENQTKLVTTTKLMQQQEIIRQNVEQALLDERNRYIEIERNLEQSLNKIKILEQENKNLELHRKELQIQNNLFKKQIQEYGQKYQVSDFIKNINELQDDVFKKDQEYQKLVVQWNELCDKMEDILVENRLLRETAQVPANYGINIEQIKIGDRVKIEDYKAKIRILQREIDSLESERAQLKHKIIFMANSLEMREPPFSYLVPEQKKAVAEYAQALYENRVHIVPERYELIKENDKQKMRIEYLEKQVQNLQTENAFRVYGLHLNRMGNSGLGENMPENLKEFFENIKKDNEELRNLIRGKYEEAGSGLPTQENIGGKNNHNNNTNPIHTQSISREDHRLDLSYMQLPPYPLIDNKDIDNTGYGYSHKFNTKLKIDPTQIHALFGIAKNDTDLDALKIESAHLQVQMIETLEILDRLKNQDELLNDNLGKLYDKLENIALIQNELFERYTNDKKNFEFQISNATKKNNELIQELNDFKRKDKALEDTLRLLETKDLNLMEKRAIEKMREIAILDINHLKLTRKYESLFEEETKLRKYLNEMENSVIEKDSHLETTIIKLKEWKQMLTFYLKLLMKKLKNSVEKGEFDKLLEENKYLREKQHEMIIRDIDITKKISLIESYKIKTKELERNFYSSEEMRIDSDIELNYLKKRLQDLDAEFNLQETLFRKFIKSLNNLEISFSDIKKVFDPNNNGNIDKWEFITAVKSLKLDFNEREINLLIKSLNFIDEKNNIDTYYFIRKLERCGIEEENAEEKLLANFIESIKKSGLSLKSVFELFDSSGDGLIGKDEFKFALNQLNLNISEETIMKLLYIITGDAEIEQVNYNQFCEIFDSRTKYLSIKNKKNNQVKSSLKIDWKTNLFASILDSLRRNSMSFKQAFDTLDKDKSGVISKNEFSDFIRKINVNFTQEEIEALFSVLDKDNNGIINREEFARGLEECQFKIDLFQKMIENEDLYRNNNGNANNYNNISSTNMINAMNNMSNNLNSNTNNNTGNNFNDGANNASNTKLAHKSILLEEKEKYYMYKIQQMRLRIDELEKSNSEVSKQLEEYATKHIQMSEKYFKIMEESAKMKGIYDLSITREELKEIEALNDTLSREVTILRIGLNTFKDLYKSSCKQIKNLNLNNAKNLDELDTYKKAMKELQSDSNSQALIGKLYYSLLISRWRESAQLKKYDDLITDLAQLKEENYKLESINSGLIKEVTELQTITHEKIIENIRLEDLLQNYSKPIVTVEQLDELKSLVRDISQEKTNLTEKYFEIRRDNLRLITENEELKNKMDYSNMLVQRIKLNCNDEYSAKLIEITEELSKYRLSESVLTRENAFYKEGEVYLRKLIEHNDRNIKNLEQQNSEWELKYRKAEENWRKKDEERQKKFFEQLRKMSLDELRFGNKGNKNLSNLNLGNLISAGNSHMMKNISSKSQANFNKGNLGNNMDNELLKATVADLEIKLKQIQDMLQIKNNEIQRLENVITETQEALKNSNNLKDFNFEITNANQFKNKPGASSIDDPYNNLLSSNHMNIIQEDETRMVAQTAHKTIKTLQDLLESKNAQISKKDEIIEQLKNDLIKNKEIHLNQVTKLQDQIHVDSQNTMNKLKSVIESVNSNLIVKVSKNQLSAMTLADIEQLIDEKDANLKLLAIELKSQKEQNEFLQLKIFDLNKRIGELSLELNEEKLNRDSKTGQLNEITKLKNVIKEKSELIDEEKERIRHLREEFGKRMDEKYHLEEQLFKYSVHVPERLVESNDKALIYNKLQSVRNKNKKLVQEIENLNKKIEENKNKYAETDKKIDKLIQENKAFLSIQAKDTRTIAKLKKEKEELKDMLEKLREENENLKKLMNNNMLNSSLGSGNVNNTGTNNLSNNLPTLLANERDKKLTASNYNSSSNFNKKRSDSRKNISGPINSSKPTLAVPGQQNRNNTLKDNSDINVNIGIYNKNNFNANKTPSSAAGKNISLTSINNNVSISKDNIVNTSNILSETPEDLMKKLISICLKKKINIAQHLQRYDFSKSGELTKYEFTNAIEELKAGILSNDIIKILTHYKLGVDHINIKLFANTMMEANSDPAYEQMFGIKNIENLDESYSKQPSKKYENLENKDFNINY